MGPPLPIATALFRGEERRLPPFASGLEMSARLPAPASLSMSESSLDMRGAGVTERHGGNI